MRDGSAGLFWRSDDDALIISPRWPPWGHEVRDESRNLDQRPFARQAAWVPTNVPLYRLAAEEEKNDVGGLLLLFCATRTIISPAYLLIQYYLIFAHLGGISRVFAVAPWLSFLVAGDVLLTALGMWAGVLIWKLRAFGVRLAKWYLVSTVVYPLVLGLLLQKLGMGALAQPFGTNLGTSLIFSTLWFIYLCTSERVRNIYEVDQARRVPRV